MKTVIESGTAYQTALKLMGEEGYCEFIVFLANNPEAGDVISHAGGFRKLRWARPGMGKRGGARVIYLPLINVVVVMLVYSKNESDNVTAAQKETLRDIARRLKESEL